MKNGIGSFFKENAIQIMGMVVIILNLWLASKLSPLVQGLALIDQRVQAIEISYIQHNEIDARLENIMDRLERIETKLDRHLER
jgi:hypothetical protein